MVAIIGMIGNKSPRQIEERKEEKRKEEKEGKVAFTTLQMDH